MTETNRFKKALKKPQTTEERQTATSEQAAIQSDTPLPFMPEMVQPQTAADNGVVVDNLGDIPQTKQNGKTKGFYLSYEVLAAVEKIATQRNIKQSPVVEKALRQALMIG